MGLNNEDGAYFPAGSLFTEPDVEPARLAFSFGPNSKIADAGIGPFPNRNRCQI